MVLVLVVLFLWIIFHSVIRFIILQVSITLQILTTLQVLREDIKYYFADFVRKGGTPPP